MQQAKRKSSPGVAGCPGKSRTTEMGGQRREHGGSARPGYGLLYIVVQGGGESASWSPATSPWDLDRHRDESVLWSRQGQGQGLGLHSGRCRSFFVDSQKLPRCTWHRAGTRYTQDQSLRSQRAQER